MNNPTQPMPDKPPELETHIHAGAPYGRGVYKRLGFRLFEASLWTDAPVWSFDDIFALSIRYDRGFSGHDLVERSLSEMRRTGGGREPELRAAFGAELARLFRTVAKGDVFTALYTPALGAEFFHNAATTGNADDILSRRFLDIWLSPQTSEPALRHSLLSLETVSTASE